MSKTFLAVMAAAIMVTAAGTASANAKSHSVHQFSNYAPVCDACAGTVFDGVAPYGAVPRSCEPYAGTIWEGVAPY
jgi:hypothetical protein